MSIKKIVILFSGNGTNLENIIKKLHNRSFGEIKVEVVNTISNKSDTFGITRAKNLGINTTVIEHKNFSSREKFDKKLVDVIKKDTPDLVVLAGFMRILTPIFTDSIKAINIHPSLLPLFKGANAMHRSFESDIKEAGVSVHFVNSKLDSGEVIKQARLEKIAGEEFREFEDRLHLLEYELYPQSIIKVLQDS